MEGVVKTFLSHGSVMHARHGERKNAFRYPVFTLFMNCADQANVLKVFRKKYFGILGLSGRDYLNGESEVLLTAVQDFLHQQCGYQAQEVWLQTFPRMFGYVFNPVSFWFCRRNDRLEAVLCEVNNTFGERHFYWIAPEQGIESDRWYSARKVFHVSPFFPVEGFYKFRFALNDEGSRIDINYFGTDERLHLSTYVEGRFRELEADSLFAVVGRYGWMTPLVVLRIHWQALKLWRKKVQFYSKPVPPKKEVT